MQNIKTLIGNDTMNNSKETRRIQYVKTTKPIGPHFCENAHENIYSQAHHIEKSKFLEKTILKFVNFSDFCVISHH